MILNKIRLKLSSLPAKLRGMKFGKNSFIVPGYDFISNCFFGNITLGDNTSISISAWIKVVNKDAKVKIGSNSKIGAFFTLMCQKRIFIGEKCLISYNVSVIDSDHRIDDPILSPVESGPSNKAMKIVIGNGCYISAHSFINKGVCLGKRCVVGSNSVVTKSFPDYSVIAGNPAKLIRTISINEQC